MRIQWDRSDQHLIDSCPASLPWQLVAHRGEDQAQKNHGQSLTRLAERGGLTPQELYYLLRGEPWPWRTGPIPMAEAVDVLRKIVESSDA
jgi:hypothetical protein